MHVDWFAFFEAFVEHVAFDHLLDGEVFGEVDNIAEAEFGKPIGVPHDFDFVFVDQFSGLFEVFFGVLFEFGLGFAGAGFIFAGGVADLAGEIAEKEHDMMAGFLEFA